MAFNRVIFDKRKQSFISTLNETATAVYHELVESPMYPGRPDKMIPSGTESTSDFKVKFITSSSQTEGYKEGGPGFVPETYKFILSAEPVPEESILNGSWRVGKVQPIKFMGRVYGYRSPLKWLT